MKPSPATQFGLIFLLILSLCLNCLAQESTRKKKIKDFGSSLKRMRWDPQTQTVVDASPPSADKEVDDVIRIDTTLVTSDVLVLDQRGNNVSGLTADDFVITENDIPQKVSHLFAGDSKAVPRSIVLIIDYSFSQFPYLKTSIEAAKTLVDKLNPQDRMAIVTDDVELILDFTHDKANLKKKLDSLVEKSMRDPGPFGFRKPQRGRSHQYSALMATLNEAFDEEDQRPIVIFQTDGDEATLLQNPIVKIELPPGIPQGELAKYQKQLEEEQRRIDRNRRPFSLEDIQRKADKSRATIYTVVPGFRYDGLTSDEQVAQHQIDSETRRVAFLAQLSPSERKLVQNFPVVREVPRENILAWTNWLAKLQSGLTAIASSTGGWTEFLEDPSQADRIYSRIFSDINQRYIVGYYPTNKDFDGKRRRIQIEVRGHPDYQILGRKSYYAPGPGNH